ncbi:MAG: hypothetical protein ABI679_08170 [Gemmatimonadota bacterium]
MIRRIGLVLFMSFTLGSRTGVSQAENPGVSVREIADSSLRDVAVAVADPLDPVIYYNPRLMERFGPNLSAFVLAHEYGHIRFGHRRIPARIADRASMMRSFELEADCYAARVLEQVKPSATAVAIEFFRKMGEFRYDDEHPTGSERAARIDACRHDPIAPNGDALAAGFGPQVIASLLRMPGEPGPMAMLKSGVKVNARKAARRTAKPGMEAQKERIVELP